MTRYGWQSSLPRFVAVESKEIIHELYKFPGDGGPQQDQAWRSSIKWLKNAFTNVINDEHEIYSQTTITPVLDEKGEVFKLVAIDSNITNIKRANEKIENQRNELENLNATKLNITTNEIYYSAPVDYDTRFPYVRVLQIDYITNTQIN